MNFKELKKKNSLLEQAAEELEVQPTNVFQTFNGLKKQVDELEEKISRWKE